MKHIGTIKDNTLVQQDNFLYVINPFENPDWAEATTEDELDFDGKIELLPNGKIKIHELIELYQFNCCYGLLNIIKLIQMATNEGVQIDLPKTLEDTGMMDATFELNENNDVLGATFSFTFNGQEVKGHGTFIKYWFFPKIEESVNSVADLMNLYIGVSALTQQAALTANVDHH